VDVEDCEDALLELVADTGYTVDKRGREILIALGDIGHDGRLATDTGAVLRGGAFDIREAENKACIRRDDKELLLPFSPPLPFPLTLPFSSLSREAVLLAID